MTKQANKINNATKQENEGFSPGRARLLRISERCEKIGERGVNRFCYH